MSKTKKILIPVVACLVVAAVVLALGFGLNWFGPKGEQGAGGEEPGGAVPEGVDPIVASIAVFPGDKSLDDVADATIAEVTEEDARGHEILGAHLPAAVAEGYHFKTASLYETTMKDGSKYYMLLVTYTNGDAGNSDTMPGAHDSDDYSVRLLNFEPDTDIPVYTVDNVPEDIQDSGFFYVKYGDIYAGFEFFELSRDEILEIINSIK